MKDKGERMTIEEALSHPWFTCDLPDIHIPSAYHRSLYRSRHREARDDITCALGRVLAPVASQSDVQSSAKTVRSAERPLVSPLRHTIGRKGEDVKLGCLWKDLGEGDAVKW